MSKVETAAHQTLWPNRPHDTQGHRMLFQTGKTSLFFTEHWNSIRASNIGTKGVATSIHEPKQLTIYPRDKHIQQNMAQRFAYSRHKLWANTGRLDMGLISSSTHQQSFHAFRWSWCAGHGHEGPSSDADHGGSWIARGFC